MTNDPFDSVERPVWLSDLTGDPRFYAALRMDGLLNIYHETGCEQLSAWSYNVDPMLSETALGEIRRFLEDWWIRRIQPKYMTVSLPPDFQFPEDSARGKIIETCVLAVSREFNVPFNVPFVLIIGVKRAVNPQLGLAGDGMGKADLTSLEHLLCKHPDNKFLATLLSREN